MSKSTPTRRSLFGRARDVTVLAAAIETNYARRAKTAFWLVGLIVGLLTAAIATSYMHPIVAILLAAVVGIACGAIVWALVRVWPIARYLWWWLTEGILVYLAYKGYAALATVPGWPLRLLILAVVLGVPASIGPTRRAAVGLFFCLYSRHRLRVLFTDVIKSNQHGSLPLILWARPTPIGERVWIFLRPGLSKTDLVTRTERIAATCHCTSVTVEQPGANAAFLRVDIKRREVLTKTVASPLPKFIDPATPALPKPPQQDRTLVIPAGLNLDGVPLVKYVPSSAARAGKKPAVTPADPHGTNGSANGKAKPVHPDEDWI